MQWGRGIVNVFTLHKHAATASSERKSVFADVEIIIFLRSMHFKHLIDFGHLVVAVAAVAAVAIAQMLAIDFVAHQ